MAFVRNTLWGLGRIARACILTRATLPSPCPLLGGAGEDICPVTLAMAVPPSVTIYMFAVLCIPQWLPMVGATRTRDNVVRGYFEKGFSNRLILCFLIAYHDIHISLSTLKRILRRLKLRRRGSYSSLQYVGRCVLVSAAIQRLV